MNASQRERIEQHGRNLLAIFPTATEKDPVKLCTKLRKLERLASAAATDACNIPDYDETAEAIYADVETKLTTLLGNAEHTGTPNVFINRDPRGYALKICGSYLRTFGLTLHTDMGGYGIIAPEIK